jgi:hypothetical protein
MPEVGSFIFMRMMGLHMRMLQERLDKEAKKDEEPKKEEEAKEKVSGEMQVRALTFSIFSGGIGFEDFKFIQSECLKAVSKRNEVGAFMPIISDGGVWTVDGEEVKNDVGLVMKLTTEVLILCYSDFFEESSPGI